MTRLKRTFKAALIVLFAICSVLVTLFISTYNKCITSTVRNESNVEARDIRIRVKNDEVMFIPSLGPAEETTKSICVNRSAPWSIQYGLPGASNLTQSPLNDVYIDAPGRVGVEIVITPRGPMAWRK